MAWVDLHVVVESKDLVEAVIHIAGTAASQVRSSTLADEECIAREKLVINE